MLKKMIAKSRRHHRVRAKVSGTASCPRLSVHKSLRHLRAQLIDDVSGRTLGSASTLNSKAKSGLAEAARLGKLLAEQAKASGITRVVFDRGGYPYHGQIKAVAEAARENGLKF